MPSSTNHPTAPVVILPEDTAYEQWGQSTAIDLHGCDLAAISDPERVSGYLSAVVPAINMVPFGPPNVVRFGEGELEGWTGVQLIQTSSITLHCDEAGHRVFIDVFSCKPFAPAIAVMLAVECFGGVPRVATTRR